MKDDRIDEYKTAKGETRYRVKYRTADGTDRTSRGFRTKKEARAFKAARQSDRRCGMDYDPAAGKVTFREAAQAWLDSRHDLKPATRAAYRDSLARTTARTAFRHKRLESLRIDEVFGGYPLKAINREQISEWVQRMVAAGKKPSTVRNAYFLVRGWC